MSSLLLTDTGKAHASPRRHRVRDGTAKQTNEDEGRGRFELPAIHDQSRQETRAKSERACTARASSRSGTPRVPDARPSASRQRVNKGSREEVLRGGGGLGGARSEAGKRGGNGPQTGFFRPGRREKETFAGEEERKEIEATRAVWRDRLHRRATAESSGRWRGSFREPRPAKPPRFARFSIFRLPLHFDCISPRNLRRPASLSLIGHALSTLPSQKRTRPSPNGSTRERTARGSPRSTRARFSFFFVRRPYRR